MYLPLSIDTLESKRFSPRKNYDTNQLENGLLQLNEGTFIVCDETVMKGGTIKETGVANIKALATLIEQQTVEYDFQYYQQSYPVNFGVLLLSDGRSMFKNTFHVPLPIATSAQQALPFDDAKFK
jgi:Mini-chromosome maintenance replisome factor